MNPGGFLGSHLGIKVIKTFIPERTNMSIKLTNKYFLLDNGSVLYDPKGIDPKFTKETKDEGTKVALYKAASPRRGYLGGNIALTWLGIVTSTNSLVELEAAEEEYFSYNPFLTNYFYTSLTGKKHTLPISKWKIMPSEHVKALIYLNRISLIDQMKMEESSK